MRRNASTWVTLALGLFILAACDRLLGLRDPSLEQGAQVDAAIDAPIDAALACVPSSCPFGCDTVTDMCRPGKLWLFRTTGSFLANGFGGADTPPNPRAGADARCLVAYNAQFTARQCNPNNVRAVIHINAADSIATMASRYNVPAGTGVYRATDQAQVSNTWGDLINPIKMPLVSPTDAPTEAEGIVWTGANGATHCNNWTSGLSTDSGMRGYTTLTEVTWLNRDTFRCDRLARLLCVCW